MSEFPYANEVQRAAAQGSQWVWFDDNGGDNDIPGELPVQMSVPAELIEAVVYVETGGTWDPTLRTPTGNPDAPYAVGLGQLVPGGSQEIAWYEEVADTEVTEDQLLDPQINLSLTSFGLGARMSALQDRMQRQKDKDNWLFAASSYFGIVPNPDGSLPEGSDALGTTGASYITGVADYIRETYGQDRLDQITNAPGFDPQDWIKDKVVDGANSLVTGLLGALGEFAAAYLPRVGIALIGVIALGLGVYAMLREAVPVG